MSSLIRYNNYLPKSEGPITGVRKIWWPGEVRVINDSTRASKLWKCNKGWEIDGAATGTDLDALPGLVSGDGIVRVIGQSAVPIVHTGTTAATLLADVPIPANVMGPNGALRVTAYWSMTNSANSKNLTISWGGVSQQIWSAGLSSVGASGCQVMVHNRGSTGSQIANGTGTAGSFGTLPAMVTASEDTTIQQRIRFAAVLANAADTLTLERYTVEVLR